MTPGPKLVSRVREWAPIVSPLPLAWLPPQFQELAQRLLLLNRHVLGCFGCFDQLDWQESNLVCHLLQLDCLLDQPSWAVFLEAVAEVVPSTLASSARAV